MPQTLLPLGGDQGFQEEACAVPISSLGLTDPFLSSTSRSPSLGPHTHFPGRGVEAQSWDRSLLPPQAGLRAGGSGVCAPGSLMRPLPVRLLLCGDVQNETVPVLGMAVGHRLPKPGSHPAGSAGRRLGG